MSALYAVFSPAVTCLAAFLPPFGDSFTASALCDLRTVKFCIETVNFTENAQIADTCNSKMIVK